MISIYSIIGLMVLGQLVVIEIHTLKYLRSHLISRYYFILLLCLSFLLIHELLIHSRFIILFPHFTFTGEAITLLIWPLIFLITKEVINNKRSSYDFLHFLPFLIYSLFRLDKYLMSSGEKSKLLEAFYNNIDNQTLVAKEFIWSEFVYDLLLFRIQPLIYIIVVLIYINSQKSSQKIEKTSKHLYWLKIIIFGFLTIWGLKYLSFILGYFIIPFTIKHPLTIIFITIQVFLISQLALTSKTGIPEVFSLKKGITKKELEAIARKAKNCIEENNTYLNKEITLHYLSKKINTNSSYLSKAINHHYKLSFTDFLNQFRIKKAKEIIESPKIDIYTMEAIAKQSGFKSISTFNRAFLKFEGQTPSQYKSSVNL